MTIEINVKGFPTSNTMYCHFLVEMDVVPIFLYQSCPLCPYESRKTNISQTNTFKLDILIWQLLGLERTLLSELPRMNSVSRGSDILRVPGRLRKILGVKNFRGSKL